MGVEGGSADVPGGDEGGVFVVVDLELFEPGFFEAEDGGVGEKFFVEFDEAGRGDVGTLDGLEDGETVFFGETDVIFEAGGIVGGVEAGCGIAGVDSVAPEDEADR